MNILLIMIQLNVVALVLGHSYFSLQLKKEEFKKLQTESSVVVVWVA